MHHNNQPKIKASSIPFLIHLHPGQPPAICCRVCGDERLLFKGMVRPHERRNLKTNTVDRCPWSGQRIILDVRTEADLEALRMALRPEAVQEVAARRATTVHRKVQPAPAPAVHQMANRRRQPA